VKAFSVFKPLVFPKKIYLQYTISFLIHKQISHKEAETITDENEKEHGHDHGTVSKRHMLLMALCCILPVIVLMALFAFFPETPYLGFFATIICPLAMVLMYLPNLLNRKKKT